MCASKKNNLAYQIHEFLANHSQSFFPLATSPPFRSITAYPTYQSSSTVHHYMSYYSLSSSSITPIPSPRPSSPTMAEPQPSELHEGAADAHAPTATAEDRKAAAALSTLDTQDDAGAKKDVDTKALDKAMEGLNVQDSKREEKKVVKVEVADVNLLVSGFGKVGWDGANEG